MREYIRQWCDSERILRGREARGVEAYARRLGEFLDWFGDIEGPGDVKQEDVDAYMRHLYMDRDNSNATRAGKLSALRSFFRYLTYSGVLAKDPTAGVPSPRFLPRTPRKFTRGQLGRLFHSPDTATPQGLRDRAMLMTIYAAGLRKMEVVGLDVKDIADSGSNMAVYIHGKGGKERTVPLGPAWAEPLRAWLSYRVGLEAGDGAVFVALQGPAHRLSPGSVTNVLKKYARMVRIRSAEAFVHKLRATWATDLYDSGVELVEIQKLAGWSDLNTAQRYIVISEKMLSRAAMPDSRLREIGTGGRDAAKR